MEISNIKYLSLEEKNSKEKREKRDGTLEMM